MFNVVVFFFWVFLVVWFIIVLYVVGFNIGINIFVGRIDLFILGLWYMFLFSLIFFLFVVNWM